MLQYNLKAFYFLTVVYEAVAGVSSLIAIRPNNLRKQHLLPESNLSEEEVVSLLISALDVIPSLPYYLAADLWRINALKEMDATTGESTYESSTVTYISSSTEISHGDNSSYNMIRKDEAVEEIDVDRDHKNGTEKEKSEEAISYLQTTPISRDVTYEGQFAKIYDIHNLTADWWKYREQLQGIGNSDGQLYADYLLDEKIIWNKPYLR